MKNWTNHKLDQSQPSINWPVHSFPSDSPHTGPRVEQGTDNNNKNNNSIPFSLSVKTNGDSDLVETFIQYA